MTIKLYQPPRAWGLPNISPHAMELETWLLLTETPHELAPWPPAVAPPKGKFPYIDDNGTVMGDAALIIEHLKRTRKIDPDSGLSPRDRAASLALRRMVKENLYWVLVQGRWQDPAGWEIYSPLLLQMLPPDVLDKMRKGILEQLAGQGLGRHSIEEINQIGEADLTALSDYLGDRPFFFGDRPTGADATMYAQLANIISAPFDYAAARFARQQKNLVDYCERMRQRYFKDVPVGR